MTERWGGLAGRLLTRYLLASAVSILLLGLVFQQATRGQTTADLSETMAREARAVVALLEEVSPDAMDEAVDDLARALDGRLTIIEDTGRVLADSEADPQAMDTHGDRPEVIDALRDGTGAATRRSDTLQQDLHYVAVQSGDSAVVRLAVPIERVDRLVAEARADTSIWVVAVFALGAVAVWLIGRRLARPLSEIATAAAGIAEGEYDARLPPVPPREVARLARVVNTLADEIGVQLDAVREEREIRDSILTSVDLGIVLVDESDEVRFLNAAAAGLMGHQPASLADFSPLSLQSLVLQARRENAAAETTVDFGSPPRVIIAGAHPLADGELVVTLRDVTESQRFAAARRDFVADASHELKTPLASIRSAAETVQRAIRSDPDAAEHFARQVEQQADRMGHLVADLLELSRLEAGAPEMEPVAVSAVLSEELGPLRVQAGAAGIVVEEDFEAVTVLANSRDLGTLVRNLIDNAIRHTPEGGRVHVALHAGDDEAVITVRDTGTGISQKDQERIFERFYRVDSARSRNTGGTGLGLAIAKHIAGIHGGSIEVDSKLGEGATFTVRLPR
jgi:two-component system phosphate regulon sensor histidine kinase PhoR